MTPIAEYGAVDRARFDGEIRPAGQPAILRGLARDWPAVQAACSSDEAIVDYAKRFSHAAAFPAIVGEPSIKGRFFYTDDLTALNFTRGQSPLDPFLDRLLRDRGAAQPYAMAIQSAPVPDLLPGFVAENVTDLLDPDVVPRLWIGNAIRVATHYDLMENVGVVIAGRRRFTLFPPDQLPNLYMGPLELTPAGTPVSVVDPAAPDLARYPRFAEASRHAQVAELEPGDAIYIPFHWWHAVDSLAPVNLFMNYWWNPAPPGLGDAYNALLAGLYAIAALPADQRAAWREMFDWMVFRAHGDPAAHLPPAARGVLGELDAEKLGRMRATLLDSLSRQG
ncbi:cupin-like domain-containing protein [Sphingomonas sp. AR_OL41]|uniref:cupin-like domain-containing protein n=1 Tax=Sphingomonas sp. AR_OL41 TaxID=3042729 RepID=UPI0024813E07|nr:cupin-like domain-containing protein [Sphingomonas sp. AR_OL41]MDH7970776.1 cupin-like domain-containing protein [Sphingomonas sp. AR_OL41]